MTTTILAVDDHPTLLRFLAEFLEHEGFRVVRANRGQSALKAFFEERPDLVVLDLMIPGMVGGGGGAVERKATHGKGALRRRGRAEAAERACPNPS